MVFFSYCKCNHNSDGPNIVVYIHYLFFTYTIVLKNIHIHIIVFKMFEHIALSSKKKKTV